LRARANGTVTRRLDYLPSGEPLLAGVGGRTTGQGYEAAEDPAKAAVRFTGKERDAETGLDSFGARYMSSAQGSFTSPDPKIVTSVRLKKPQELNLLPPPPWLSAGGPGFGRRPTAPSLRRSASRCGRS
jgi:RHS repeat-associated protein